MDAAVCGTLYAYTRLKHRDPECREANAQYHRSRRKRYWRGKPLEHGKRSTYINYGCTCEPCRTAHAEYEKARV